MIKQSRFYVLIYFILANAFGEDDNLRTNKQRKSHICGVRREEAKIRAQRINEKEHRISIREWLS